MVESVVACLGVLGPNPFHPRAWQARFVSIERARPRRKVRGVMMSETEAHLFTSESVTEGHPDKVADQISDAILDEVMAQDPTGRVACETLVTTGMVLLAGEVTTKAYVDFAGVARRVIREIGYTHTDYGFD